MQGTLALIPASSRRPRLPRVVVLAPAPIPDPVPAVSERREALYLMLVDLVADVRAATFEASFDAAVMLDRLKLTALAAFPV